MFELTKFREVYPQFAAMTDAQIDWQAALALEAIKKIENWGLLTEVQLEHALYALACHLCTMLQRSIDGQSGPVASAAEGSVNASFAVPPVDKKSYYLQTPCGQAYLSIIRPLLYGGRFYGFKEFHPW